MCSQGVQRGVLIAIGVFSGCSEGCVDSHGCFVRVINNNNNKVSVYSRRINYPLP